VTEGSKRLRPDIEAELLRIAQEGMNNAARHAAASRIDVAVTIQAPDAIVTVVDDGRGLQPGRDDSHGVRIMRERARRIGATLVLHSPEDTGTELRVVLGSTPWLEAPGDREGIAS
jgi:signal transduction histidine kinase